jgi:regulator of protease activity HflC (stomatin/prohibitin superfamily)
MSPTSKSSDFGKAIAALSLEKFATTLRADFRFAPLNALLLVAIFVIGLVVHLALALKLQGVSPAGEWATVQVVVLYLASAVALAVLLRVSQVWEAVVVLATADSLISYLILHAESTALILTIIATIVAAALIAPAVQIAYQWERAVVLRFGRFQGLRKPGVFVVVPIIDKVAQFVDQRIRVTDFSAETTLTADTVPVNVDAIAFWMVWDAQKSVLEVEHFDQAVVLSAQTALRNAIGKYELGVLLSERDRLGQEIQETLDEKTSAWGITTQSVEIRDIIIPKGLEDAMSRQAQAERERQSRIILGTAETEIAEKFARASEHYRDNPVALHLRAMNMVYEGLRQKGSMIIVPSTAVETMGLGALGGLTAFGKEIPPGPGPEQEGGKQGGQTPERKDRP